MVRRIYVEKKPEFQVAAVSLKGELKEYLNLKGLENVRILIRYDIENVSDETYLCARNTIFSEPPVDDLYEETFARGNEDIIFSVEYLPGQFDQRADSAEQCVKLLNSKEHPVIHSATTYVISGSVNEDDLARIKAYCINPVDSRETDETKPETLVDVYPEAPDVAVLEGFCEMDDASFEALYASLGLAMTLKDFEHIRTYYREEEYRNPTMTEIRVLDTYWSDHCRHTTFLTELKDVVFEDGAMRAPIEGAYEQYLEDRKSLYAGRKDKFVSLMDVATLGMKKLRAEGKLDDLEESDEINACSIVVPVEIDGVTEEWLVFFKNETHNHPTEIEPFGGAATCLGGAIRDPLSGRGYVYQAMRITGAADPTRPLSETLHGKLPQRKITTGAASGYSSYGNQIGLATGYVHEIYHPNYVAKRMEIGAVMGAAPRKNVIRETSDPGDQIILLGGRTGRDGCGGATGASKAHTDTSIDTCGAEVQKGNAPTERKIQRLFRRPEVTKLIKKCNDFGAGGVSVAIGELADGLHIFLDRVPKKYAGLDGTELAISESQERMAIVVAPKDVDAMLAYAAEENLEAIVAAEVKEDPRLVMFWRGKTIVDLSRAFLDTNGAHQETNVRVEMPEEKDYFASKPVADVKGKWLETLSDLNVCSQKGLVEMFDSSIGAATVTMPYGGKKQLTPIQTMTAKLPVLSGKCDTVTQMSYGFDPYLSSWSPFHGASYAVLSSVAKIVAAGGDYKKIRLTFQEYFKRMTEDPARWGQPLSALLGAYEAQVRLGLPAIGGKDSMSGSFNEINVPPTLVSFAVNVGNLCEVVTDEFKTPGDLLVKFPVYRDAYQLPDYEKMMKLYDEIHALTQAGVIKTAYALGYGGICEAVSTMGFGNALGADLDPSAVSAGDLFVPEYGAILACISKEDLKKVTAEHVVIGQVNASGDFTYGDVKIDAKEALDTWKRPLEKVFPTDSGVEQKEIPSRIYREKQIYVCKNRVAKPTVFIPVFPGTNCEYDTAKSFIAAGANVNTVVFRNTTPEDIPASVEAFEKALNEAQILMFPGGFSAGDEPDGSGKFIATAFRNERLKEAVHRLLQERDGLALGICNGFQALIKLGLVPYGEITEQKAGSPTLTTNHIGRHISKSVYTKVVSNKSPWLLKAELGGVYAIPASHGEGRFVADQEWLEKLFANGQVATQYVDLSGNPTMDEDYNPNGSYLAIEGITSPDGRVLGKMAHSERRGDGVAINITGEQNQMIFASGVEYFR
ncbi:MAG: phosphoribosylformylglycinamidine synthase [Lachnospiraceae bacterium]|nr:phosphoribosylformylglycinamidine synthase [Lachnospiraceae bacterium]